MSKFYILSFLALLGIGSIFETALAQDPQNGRARRTQDHRRGMRDGRDCTMLVSRVAESACYDAKGGPYGGDYGACARIMQMIAQDPEAFVADILAGHGWNRHLQSSPGTEGLAREAAACQGNRQAGFDRDVEREEEELNGEPRRQ